jgi:hypothetical protein
MRWRGTGGFSLAGSVRVAAKADPPFRLSAILELDSVGVHLHPRGEGSVLLRQRRAPVEALALNIQGDTLISFEPPHCGPLSWDGVALPVIPVSGGFLQFISE